MSEFKFACPICGQHMMCDESHGGSVMECPTCFQKITAPQAPAPDAKFILTGTKAGERNVLSAAWPGADLPAAKKGFPIGMLFGVVLFAAVAAVFFMYQGKFLKPARTNPSAAGGSPGPASRPANSSTPDVTANLVLNRPALASSQEGQHPVQFGNDGNDQTRWCASGSAIPQWWEVDLGGAAVITNTQVIWEHDAVYQYVIQISSDNTQWTKLVDRTTNATPAPVNSDSFSASGRYLRLVVTGLAPNSWASFYEFRAFGSVGAVAGGAHPYSHANNRP